MSNQVSTTVSTILAFLQYVLHLFMSQPLYFMAVLFMLAIGKKGSIKVGGSGITLGK